MTPAEATALVVAMRNRCPVRPGSVPYQLTADHRQALTLLLAAAATEHAEPRQLPRTIRTSDHMTLGEILALDGGEDQASEGR